MSDDLLSPEEKLRKAGAMALAKAIELFNLDVWDPSARDHRPIAERWRDTITELIGGDGKGNGLGWGWEGRYAGDGDFEWCGAFAARCWQAGGLSVLARRESWASCYRLQRWAKYRPISDRKPAPVEIEQLFESPRLCVAFDERGVMPAKLEVRPGDVLIVGGVGTGPGKHITIIERFDPSSGMFHTYEGNAGGTGPDGKRRQGIVRAVRPLGLPSGKPPSTYHARWLIRPAPSDLV